MVRKKTAKQPPTEAAEVPAYLGMSPNQVVAYNLAQARAWKNWTQDEAADALASFLGTRWSKASFSQAERSVGGKFVRNFSADEFIAFARAFELPFFFFKQKTAYEIGLGIPAEPLFRSLGTVRHPRRFKIVVIDIQITLKQMLRDFIGIRVNRAKKSGMVNITSSVNSRERSGINTILHELNPLFTINVTMRDIKSKNVYSR